MKKLLLDAAAAIALAVAPTFAHAQDAHKPVGGGGAGMEAGGLRHEGAGGAERSGAGVGRGLDSGAGAASTESTPREGSRGMDEGSKPSARDMGEKAGTAAGDRPVGGMDRPDRAPPAEKPGAADEKTAPGDDRARMDRSQSPDMDKDKMKARDDLERGGSKSGAGMGDHGDSKSTTATESDSRRSSKPRATISGEQRMSIKQTVIRSGGVHRVSRSTLRDVSVTVGARVPRSVTIERLPPEIVEIVPDYASYSYFVLDDDTIVIVDPETYEIVYVIEA